MSLQEMVTPVLRLKAARPVGSSARIVEARWTGAKCRVMVSGNSDGIRVDVRTRQSDPNTSLLADRQPREVTADGGVTVFLEDDSDIGKDAVVVLLDAAGQVITYPSRLLRPLADPESSLFPAYWPVGQRRQ
jgi:hypothetical protein